VSGGDEKEREDTVEHGRKRGDGKQHSHAVEIVGVTVQQQNLDVAVSQTT
jgi:hypothetical protein